MANKALKYRLYPTTEQEIFFAKTFGCCRKIWNLMLSDKIESYKITGRFAAVTPVRYKKAYPYLKETDSLALANVQLNLQAAFKNCFDKTRKKRNGFPKYKSAKRSRRSYTTNNQKGTIVLTDKGIRLPKIGRIRASVHRLPEEGWVIKSATVSQNPDGKYYCSVLFEYEAHIPEIAHPEKNAVGLDYKSDGLYVDSDGRTCGSPKFFRKSQKRLAKEQRRLSRREKGSSNYNKSKLRVAKAHGRIANQRKDFLHKESAAIAKQYDMVCVEDLNMRAMANKGFGNGKATLDNGYGMFLNMLKYKLEDQGKLFVVIDKWYPSSQTCSVCGTVHPEVKDLSVREWTCPVCGFIHDRDVNAAVNIRNEGIRQLLAG